MVNGARHKPKVIRNRLLERREELSRLSRGTAAARRPVELDQSRVGRLSRMDALQEQEMAKDTERRRDGELHRIDAALKRLEEGDYGWCLSCGEPIPAARLELDPTVSLCVDCAERSSAGHH